MRYKMRERRQETRRHPNFIHLFLFVYFCSIVLLHLYSPGVAALMWFLLAAKEGGFSWLRFWRSCCRRKLDMKDRKKRRMDEDVRRERERLINLAQRRKKRRGRRK